MRTRRRRWFREETIAPWITILVILGLWWTASWLIAPAATPQPDVAVSSPAARSAPSAPGAPSAPSSDATPASLPIPVGGEGLVVPVAGVEAGSLQSTFNDARGGGSRRHEAMDILAPRGTPVLAAVGGRVVKLFTSAAGGLTIYQFDEEERYCYYYAHLDSYAPELTEGQEITQGQVIGFVGTTGNAPPNTPHLHFAIYRLGPDKRWWEGEPLDPIDFLR